MQIKINNNFINDRSRFAYYVNVIKTSLSAQNIVAVFVILLFAAVNVVCVLRSFALTTDEDKHYLYGENIVSGDSTRFNPSTMPATALNALPKKIASFLGEGQLKYWLSKYSVARMATIFFSCLTAYLVFHWARLLYGFVPALFSLTLYVLDPNIIAHSQLVTTDIYTAGTLVFAFFTLWKFAHERNFQNGLLCLFALGLSQLAKYTAIVIFPLFLGTLLIYDLAARSRSLQDRESVRSFIFRYAKYILFAALISILILNLGFLFNRTFTAFGEYQFRSGLLQKLQTDFAVLGFLPVPVPYPYVDGLDFMRDVEQRGATAGNIYLLGRVRTGLGFPGYYFVASILKVPISSQIIMILAFFVYFAQRKFKTNFLKNEMFLLVSVLFYVIYFNFFFKTQVGIRYFLPVFPFLYIFSGNLFTGWEWFSVKKKAASLFLLVYLAVSVFSYHPYYLSYFNEIVWNRMHAYKYLADSNLDWGQDRNELDKYLFENPDAIYKTRKVRTGTIVVRINDLVGVTADPSQYAWLRDNFEPADMIGYSYLVYKISAEDVKPLCATILSCNE